MAIMHSTGLKAYVLDTGSFGAAFNADQDGGNAAWLRIYTGAPPATADAALTGTVVAQLRINSDAFAASGGTGGIALNAVTADPSADNSNNGTAAMYFRIVRNSDDGTLSTTQVRLQGIVDVSPNTRDMTIDNAGVVQGGQVSLSAWSYNHSP